MVGDDRLSLNEGAITPWANSSSRYYDQTRTSLAEHFGFDLNARFEVLPRKTREMILFGSDAEDVTMRYHDGHKAYDITKPFEGVIPNMERRWRETDSNWVRDGASCAKSTNGWASSKTSGWNT